MNAISPHIEESWRTVLEDEFQKPYFLDLKHFLEEEIQSGHQICPHPRDIFSAFHLCPFDAVKVVLVGQDPYHGARQAHGLSFSVPEGVPIPPSLQNIYKEIQEDAGQTPLPNGNLEPWASQGVLLLNAVLTVRGGSPASHAKKGWEQWTDRVVTEISEKKTGVVFLLWGKYAQEKGRNINAKKHHILTSSHPSPFSVRRGFSGCKHFSQTNAFLREEKQKEILWGT